MIDHRALKLTRLGSALLAIALVSSPAFAVNKDMVQLQTQVHDLQDAVAHLQQSNDERMGVLKDLVQQTADSVNKMSVTVGGLQQQMRTQQEASTAKLDQVSGQVQSLNDSQDEVKAKLNSLEKAIQSVQTQMQSINAALQNLATPPPGSTPPTDGAPGTGPGTDTAPTGGQPPVVMQPGPSANAVRPSADIPFPATQGPYANLPSRPAAPANMPATDLYQAALRDYMAAKYSLSIAEFNQVIQSYPDDPFAGNSYYYLGEIDYRAGRFVAAVKDYDHVLDQYPSSTQVRVAHLHKAMALIATKQREAGIEEYRALIQRFPNSPEASQARTKLSGMGVPVTGKRPS